MAGEEAEAGLFHLLNGAGSNPALDAVALLLDISAALYVIIWWAAQLWVVKKRSLAFDYLVALLITVAVTEGLKFAIGRWRPETFYGTANVHLLQPALFPDFTDPSFPSGHTSRAFLLATLIGLHERRWLRFLLPYAIAAGLARVYEGAHYPSDVLVVAERLARCGCDGARRVCDRLPVLEVRDEAPVRPASGAAHRPVAQPWPWSTFRIEFAVWSRPVVTASAFPATIATRNDFGPTPVAIKVPLSASTITRRGGSWFNPE